MSEFIQVITTTDKQDEAENIARTLVEHHLAACVQVSGPVTSVFRWRGEVQTSPEWVCTIKTRSDLYPRVEAAIRDLHSYEVPEVLALPVLEGSADYLGWLREELTG